MPSLRVQVLGNTVSLTMQESFLLENEGEKKIVSKCRKDDLFRFKLCKLFEISYSSKLMLVLAVHSNSVGPHSFSLCIFWGTAKCMRNEVNTHS